MRTFLRPVFVRGIASFSHRRFITWLILGGLVIASALPARSEETNAYPRISEEAFKARLPFFDYDKSIPLEGRIVRDWK
ncbi:MAG: hypothetical protein NT167_20215, partial [Verrucomicrobia bacterium]|nr:hypothetical protein [Verrucomicrobiota bacterium]